MMKRSEGYDEHGNLIGGVKKPGWFNIEIFLPTFDDFKAAEPALRAAGYTVEMCPDAVDEYSDATFGIISKPAGTATVDELFDEASVLVGQLGGEADNGAIEGATPYKPGEDGF
jgi:hypothetical protein